MELQTHPARARTLIVEDEPDIAASLEYVFRSDGFQVSTSHSGEHAVELLDGSPFDLMILDLMLPDMPGFEILKHLRRQAPGDSTRVIVLTARNDEMDRILAFELGANDFVPKPFSPRELILRARAVLKRQAAGRPEMSEALRAGPIEIDSDLHEVRVDGKSIELTNTEFKLLAELVRASGRVCTRQNLLEMVWNYDCGVMTRTVDTHMRRIRSKLGPAAHWLDTVRGLGYRVRRPAPRD